MNTVLLFYLLLSIVYPTILAEFKVEDTVIWEKKQSEIDGPCIVASDCLWKNARCIGFQCNCPAFYSRDYWKKSCYIGLFIGNEEGSLCDIDINCRDDLRCVNYICTSAKKTTTSRYKIFGNLYRPCNYNYQCNTYEQNGAVCRDFVCQCPLRSHPNYETGQCDKDVQPTTSPGIKTDGELFSSCRNNFDCTWSEAECLGYRCYCPYDYYTQDETKQCLPKKNEDFLCRSNKECRSPLICEFTCKYPGISSNEDRTTTSDFAVGLSISIALIVVIIIVLICKCCCSSGSPRNRNVRRIQFPHPAGTSSTLQLLSELNDVPPDYADVFMVGPNRGEIIKPPTYEEAMQEAGWQSELLFTPTAYENVAVNNTPSSSTSPDEQPEHVSNSRTNNQAINTDALSRAVITGPSNTSSVAIQLNRSLSNTC